MKCETLSSGWLSTIQEMVVEVVSMKGVPMYTCRKNSLVKWFFATNRDLT
jgi:hypothetical protein